MFWDFKNIKEIFSSIKALQVSRRTLTQRCEAMFENLAQLMWKDIRDCKCFSLHLDESMDVSDSAPMCIFMCLVFTAEDELLQVLTIREKTRGEDIFQSLKNFIENTQLPGVQIGVHHHEWSTRNGWPCEWIYYQVQEGRCFPRLPELSLHNPPTSVMY